LEKEIKRFIRVLSTIDLALLTIIIVSWLGLMSVYFVRYRTILVFMLAAASLIFILLISVSTGLDKANRSGSARGWVIYSLGLGIRLVIPAFIFFVGLFRGDKDRLGRVYISINNMVVKHRLQKKPSHKFLMLLPHCMQSKDCNNRITENISNCQRCGCCKVGELADLADLLGINVVVSKGGTAARNSVKEYMPDLILAVACERELVSGIGDVGGIPAIGVINQRPNGYCTNTTVDMTELKNILQELTGSGKRVLSPDYEVQAKNPIA
jgi:hypothetical protein